MHYAMHALCNELRVMQTFDDAADAASWHGGRASECDGDGVLAGGCGGGGGGEVSRVVEGLPPHTGLQLRASFLFVDAWRGEHAYAKVDGSASSLKRQ